MMRQSTRLGVALAVVAAVQSASVQAEEFKAKGGVEPHGLSFGLWSEKLQVRVPAELAASVDLVTAFPVDADGNELDSELLVLPRVRLGLEIDSGKTWSVRLRAVYEHDLITGVVGDEPELEGLGYAAQRGLGLELRKAYVEAHFDHRFVLAAGAMTSHWGLGLIANDGAHGWEPGSARFSDPRSGDRVLRLRLMSGPIETEDFPLVLVLGADRVLDDDVLQRADELERPGVEAGDDVAYQGVIAVVIPFWYSSRVGIYYARREQESATGRELNVNLLSFHARHEAAVGSSGKLEFDLELAYVFGTSTLAASVAFPVEDVQQFGAAARAAYNFGSFGFVADIVYATGDRNLDDGQQNALRADPNFELGMVLFRQVTAGQTARAVATASNPELVGQPSGGVERIPTRGSVTNTIAIFPRAWVRPIDDLEIYGGPLFAFAEVPPIDPFNTRLAGGSRRNTLDGSAGSYLGTEIDLGARYRANIWRTEWVVGVEGGVLLPGSAMQDAEGNTFDPVYAGRFIVEGRL